MMKDALKAGFKGAVLGCFVCTTLCADSYTNLTDAYAAMGFDPSASGNATVVFFSDAHMNQDTSVSLAPIVTTNFNVQLVSIVNGMRPPPTKILNAGDTSTSFSEVPGYINAWGPDTDWAIQEMHDFQTSLLSFTNVAPTDILWVPGNHDQTCLETDAELFQGVYTNMPTHQSLDLAGVHFLLLNSGNYSQPDDVERQWLEGQVAALSPTQTVAIVEHYPAFCIPVMYQGMGPFLRQLFANWQTRWWTFCGHLHAASATIYRIGRSDVAEVIVGTANTNMYGGQTHDSGFEVLCLSNGVAGIIYYHFDTSTFDVLLSPGAANTIQEYAYPSWDSPSAYAAQFEDCPGLLWRRNKKPDANPTLTLMSNTVSSFLYLTPLARTTEPEVIRVSDSVDSLDWFGYTGEIWWQLQLGWHANQATHFLLALSAMSLASEVSFSADATHWSASQPEPWLGGTYMRFVIPPDIAGLPVAYARYISPVMLGKGDFIGGWGLSTTNDVGVDSYPKLAAVPNQQVVAGQLLTFTNVATDPYAPPDVVTFSLPNGPAGAAVDPQSGVFSWRPALSDSPKNFTVAVKAADSGTPEMSATQHVLITVLRPGIPFLSIVGWQQGCPLLSVSGDPGLSYTIMASTNLQDWSVLYATNPPTLPFQITDPQGAALSPRFYRVSASP